MTGPRQRYSIGWDDTGGIVQQAGRRRQHPNTAGQPGPCPGHIQPLISQAITGAGTSPFSSLSIVRLAAATVADTDGERDPAVPGLAPATESPDLNDIVTKSRGSRWRAYRRFKRVGCIDDQ